MRCYTRDHEWLEVDGDVATVGITAHARDQLGDIVFVDLPEIGRRFEAHAEAAVVESVKAAADVYAPVAGEVVETNATLADNPGLVNEDPEGAGWFFRLTLANPGAIDGLMDRAAYDAFVASL